MSIQACLEQMLDVGHYRVGCKIGDDYGSREDCLAEFIVAGDLAFYSTVNFRIRFRVRVLTVLNKCIPLTCVIRAGLFNDYHEAGSYKTLIEASTLWVLHNWHSSSHTIGLLLSIEHLVNDARPNALLIMNMGILRRETEAYLGSWLVVVVAWSSTLSNERRDMCKLHVRKPTDEIVQGC